MTDRITKQQEDALRAAEAKAPAAPWIVVGDAGIESPSYATGIRLPIALHGAAAEFAALARNAMPALLDELERLRAENRAFTQRWYEADRLNHKLLIDGAFSIDRDPMDLQPMLAMLQQCELSTGKAREVIREWLAGVTEFDLPDGVKDDEDNIDHVRAKLRETESKVDALRAEKARLVEACQRVERDLTVVESFGWATQVGRLRDALTKTGEKWGSEQ